MDCCCHLDLPIMNLDGLPGPEKAFKKESNSDLFPLSSQHTFMYSYIWEPVKDQLLQCILAKDISSF